MLPSKKPTGWLICRDRQDWRIWLESNHETETEVWLEIQKKDSPKSGPRLNEAVEEAICFGWIDSKMYRLDQEKYILHFTPRRPGSIWSLNNRNRAEALIADGRMTEAGLAVIREAQANGSWQNAYSSKDRPDVPEDLRAALQADEIAQVNFENWSASQMFQMISWLQQSRQPKTRASRIDQIIRWAHNNQITFQ